MSLYALGPNYKSRADQRAEHKKTRDEERTAVRLAVDKRDGMVCRACGCRLKRTMELDTKRREQHHIIPRSAGGAWASGNLVNVCFADHELITRHRMTVTGDANVELTFSTEERTWISEPPRR